MTLSIPPNAMTPMTPMPTVDMMRTMYKPQIPFVNLEQQHQLQHQLQHQQFLSKDSMQLLSNQQALIQALSSPEALLLNFSKANSILPPLKPTATKLEYPIFQGFEGYHHLGANMNMSQQLVNNLSLANNCQQPLENMNDSTFAIVKALTRLNQQPSKCHPVKKNSCTFNNGNTHPVIDTRKAIHESQSQLTPVQTPPPTPTPTLVVDNSCKNTNVGLSKSQMQENLNRFKAITQENCNLNLNVSLSEQVGSQPSPSPRPRSDSKRGQSSSHNCARWEEEEEVFFVAAVVDVYLMKGSLFPRTRRGRAIGYYTKQCESDTWEDVKMLFDSYKAQYFRGSKAKHRSRSSKALCRHFKTMKQRFTRAPYEMDSVGFHLYYEQWRFMAPNHYKDHKHKLTCNNKTNNDNNTNNNNNNKCTRDVISENNNVSEYSRMLWTREEEVFLIGVVMHRFLSRGSLCNSRRKGENHDDTNRCWNDIKKHYDMAWQGYQQHLMKTRSVEDAKACMINYSQRTPTQLAKHYKAIKARSKKMPNCRLQALYEEWRDVYNTSCKLLPMFTPCH